MKSRIIFVLIMINIICFSLSEKYNKQIETTTTNNKEEISTNNIKNVNNITKESFLENEKPIKLVRKNNRYWIIFLILFFSSLLFSGLYVYQDIFFNRTLSQDISDKNK